MSLSDACSRSSAEGLELREIAPGVDLERDVLAHLGFAPRMSELREMDARIFLEPPMDLRRDLLHLDLDDRIQRDDDAGRLYINFEKMRVRSLDEIARIRDRVEKLCAGRDRPVDVLVNYDGFRIDEDVEADYAAMVAELERRFYRVVTRYSSSAFTRMKLGRTFGRDRAPHIFETADDARAFLNSRGGEAPGRAR